MVKYQKGPGVTGPSSAIGIMRFFDVDTGGPKLTPEFVIGVSIVLIIVVVAIKMMS